MGFGFRLSVLIAPGERLGSDERQVELELAAPIGRVRFRASPREGAAGEAEWLVFTGSGYGTLEAAEQAGRALKNAIRLAAVDAGEAIDVGNDLVRGGPTQVAVDAAAEHGVLLLPDVHGVQVYEETGIPRVLSLRGSSTVEVPFESFTAALRSRAQQPADMSEKQALACDLFAQSRFELSQRSRHLVLCTALEVLAERQGRSGRAAQLVEEFRKAIIRARDESTDDVERAQLDSLLSGASDLRRESIGSAVRRLSASVPTAEAGGMDPADLAGKSYSVRSDLIHSGVTAQDLAPLGPLWGLVRYLVRRPRPEGAPR